MKNDWSFCYQLSGGLKVKLSKSIDINAKLAFFYTKTDELDNYKSMVPANKKNDAFNEYTLGITYHFGKKTKEPFVWKASENSIFGYNPNHKIRKNDVKEPSFESNPNKEIKLSSDDPIPTNLKKNRIKDIDENEFDCIIKY